MANSGRGAHEFGVKHLLPYYNTYKSSRFARTFKVRRYEKLFAALGIPPHASILDVGCRTGADFTRFAVEDGFRCHGLDIRRQTHLANFEFTQGTACNLPFPDHHFDAAVSVGVFEHIQPIEDLCKAASEIARVAKSYCPCGSIHWNSYGASYVFTALAHA